jgi:LmbE family N-acetylglucosaminyl deacetylase
MPDAPTRLQFTELLDEGLEPFEIPNLWLSAEEPDTYVDISKTIDIKLEALTRHESQHREESETWVRERARELGEQAGVEYAEAFKAFSFQDEEATVEEVVEEEA